MNISSILIVCTGNICRSPMAAGVLGAALPRLSVQSAGLQALIGQPADRAAIELLRARKIDISSHRAQQLNGWLCSTADLIFVMDGEQKNAIERHSPVLTGRVYKLGHHENIDIPDPYRKGQKAFEQSLNLIDTSIERWTQYIEYLEMAR
ncbi:low molecular weight phosphotyrosine protein phosphatase [Paraburkholderia aspalathi]|uniref:low molecular weight protein-tyrosine-phosphatase n=1 Tax=Paraburkholderia aspalathi TaxID=1324617 RepID=UPI0038BC434F